MKSGPSELTDHLGYWLRLLSNHVSEAFAERLGRHEVSVPQWVVLRVLFDHDSLPLKEVVARVGVDQGSLSRMVERLMARGLVERREDTADRRAVAISLTGEGRWLVPMLAREADENDRVFFAPLSEQKRGEFLEMIRVLIAASASTDRGVPLR
jgi:DNA-binding MarR family transcriptional regulator